MTKNPAQDTDKALFDSFASDYDRFFSERPDVYLSERSALSSLGLTGIGVDIGTGTGILSQHLGRIVGVDVAVEMLEQARGRGIECLQASAEALPLRSESMDFAIMSTTLCFLTRPEAALREAHRVLRKHGSLAICIIALESPWGRSYVEKGRRGHSIYKHARFYDKEEVYGMLHRTGFSVERTVSTLHTAPGDRPGEAEPVLEDDKGSYLCILARKG